MRTVLLAWLLLSSAVVAAADLGTGRDEHGCIPSASGGTGFHCNHFTLCFACPSSSAPCLCGVSSLWISGVWPRTHTQAGYSWCDGKGKCIRPSDEDCPGATATAAASAACTADSECPDGQFCYQAGRDVASCTTRGLVGAAAPDASKTITTAAPQEVCACEEKGGL